MNPFQIHTIACGRCARAQDAESLCNTGLQLWASKPPWVTDRDVYTQEQVERLLNERLVLDRLARISTPDDGREI